MVKILETDGWKGLYINNKLALEGHSLSLRDIFQVLGVDAEFEWIDPEDERWNHWGNKCPAIL